MSMAWVVGMCVNAEGVVHISMTLEAVEMCGNFVRSYPHIHGQCSDGAAS